MSDSDKKGKKRGKRFAADNQPSQDLDHALAVDEIENLELGVRFAADNQPNQELGDFFFGKQEPGDFDNADNELINRDLHASVLEGGESVTEIGSSSKASTETLGNCAENENQIELLSEAYHLVYGGPKDLLNSTSLLTEIKTPKGNTVLHIAARRGKDDVVDLVAKHDPHILFLLNKKEDTALHVAARAGHIPTVKKLLAAYANFQCHETAKAWARYKRSVEVYDDRINMEDLLELVKRRNAEGNTMLHEAMICGKGIGAMIFQAFEPYNTKDRTGKSLSESCYECALNITNHAKQSVLYLAVAAGDKEVVELILNKCPKNAKPNGLSPLVAAIMKQNEDMLLSIMLDKKPNWIHLRDQHKRLPLHYAASTGYHKGVVDLLGKCKSCSIQRDKYGNFPLHLAAERGHVETVKELLGYCPDPTEMLDDSDRNILHIAAKNGKHELVRYILQTAELYEMINQKDENGDTALHLATKSCHPKAVYYLTWDNRVDLGLVNQKNQTALDIVNAIYRFDNSSMRQQLTWTALKSAGAKPSSIRVLHVEPKLISGYAQNEKMPKRPTCERYGDRVETLLVVSTLIITASVAACLAVPGEADGAANNLYHAMFQFFIICITISFFSSISATIILFWARLGLIELLAHSLKISMRILGVSLISLSLAFLAGIYTVISKLNWLATVFVVMTVIFVVVVSLLYILLFLPSSSTIKPLRYISYYPFLFLAWLTEPKTIEGTNF